ncbi:alpha/beta hydrolase-fold protein [Parasphingopyxis sp.]|uniref:alpha/beta hydrolase n=1 Tax=Parasphingopyxis sp. TaxID=1920299 RepID=UPI00262ACD4C|nr:alpha/beta hydrolase-fold protein [Parasphingopyxis sp.]
MMKILLSALIAAAGMLAPAMSAPALAQSGAAQQVVPLDHLPALAGDYFRHESDAVGRAFHIYVRLPEGYAENTDTRYPVVYVLDGDALFPILAPTHLFLHYDDGLPEAIIVGIAYGGFGPEINRRAYDYSAPSSDDSEQYGGAPAFHRMLADELLPEIDRRFRTQPERRVLLGQSRGGAFALWSAYLHPDLFWARLAINPAFDPGREIFFGTPRDGERNDLHLMLVSGERDYEDLRRDALAWAEVWRDRDDAPWTVSMITLAGGTHAADSPNAYRAAMRWFFREEM